MEQIWKNSHPIPYSFLIPAQPILFNFKASWNSVTPVLGAEVMTHAGGGWWGAWLLCRVSLVFVLNSSVPSFTGAAVLMMPACVQLCENPPCAGHSLDGFCPLTSSQPVDACFPSSFLPIKSCGSSLTSRRVLWVSGSLQ